MTSPFEDQHNPRAHELDVEQISIFMENERQQQVAAAASKTAHATRRAAKRKKPAVAPQDRSHLGRAKKPAWTPTRR